jgi:trigger factor
MQKPTIKQLPKSLVELKFSVPVEDAKPYLDQAVAEISTARPLPGFRPGKASYEDVKRAYGEMLIWETALEKLVRAVYVKAILNENIETVGSPEISVEKLVPGQPVEFTVTAPTMPSVTELADYSKPQVDRKGRTIKEDEVEKAIEDLRKMRRSEVVTDKAAGKDDMVLVDMEIKKDHVPVEGGTSRDHRVYLNEAHYIPGFAEKLVGAKKGENKTFTLEFPKDHYNKQLAGQPMEFAVQVKDVYELQLPELNDEFAQALGVESADKLRELLTTNIQQEADHKADEAAEIELLEKLVKASRFSEVPDILLNEEVRRMMHELEHGIEEQGGKFEDYLQSIKKTKDDLRLDFVKQALQRINTAVLIKEIGKKENITVDDHEVDEEIDRILNSLRPDDKQTRERVSSPDYRDYVATQLKNRKVLEMVKEKGIKK